MGVQRTFAMLKPGVLQRRIAGEIINRFEKKGLKIVGLKIMNISEDLAKKHYCEHEGKSFYYSLIEYITSGPVLAMVIEGDEAVMLVRRLCGATCVDDSMPGTIRGDYSAHTPKNVIHSSDSPESAEREISLFFNEDEIIAWTDDNQHWF